MKKILVLVLAFICVLSLAGCNEKSQSYFNAEVLECNEGSVRVKCTNPLESGISEGAEVIIPTDMVAEKGTPKMVVGDQIRIVFNGEIMETYPLQIRTVFAIYLLDEDGQVIPNS